MTDLYTATEAAEEIGVSVNTIYSWVHREFLVHAAKRGHVKLFRLADVFAAEAARDRKYRHCDPLADVPARQTGRVSA